MKKGKIEQTVSAYHQANTHPLHEKHKIVYFAGKYLTYDCKRKSFVKYLNTLFDNEDHRLYSFEETIIKIYEHQKSLGYVYYFSLVSLDFKNSSTQLGNAKVSRKPLLNVRYLSEQVLRQNVSSFINKTHNRFYINVNTLLKDPANDVFELSKRYVNNALDRFRNASFPSLQGRLILIDLNIDQFKRLIAQIGIKIDSQSPVTMRTRHMHSILTDDENSLYGLDKHAHGLSNQQFINALKAVNKPLLLAINQERIYALTDIHDRDGNNIVCAFKLDNHSHGLRLLSVYGKKLTSDFFIHNKVMYLCKKIKRAVDATPPNAGRFANALYEYILKLSSIKVNE